MAVEKMTMVTLTGPQDMIDIALQKCVINREFHPENAVSAMQSVKQLSPFSTANPYSGLMGEILSLMGMMELSPEFEDFGDIKFNMDNTRAYIRDFSKKLEAMLSELREKRDTVRDCGESLTQLTHLRGVDEKLDDLLHMKYIGFGFGSIPRGNYAKCIDRISTMNNAILISTSEEDDWVYCMYFYLPRVEGKVNSILATMGFKKIWILEKLDIAGNADDAEHMLKTQISEAKEAVEKLEKEINELCLAEQKSVLTQYSYLRFLSETFALRAYAGFSHGIFYIIGWVPAQDAEEYAAGCEKITGLSCVLANDREIGDSPPVKMKRNFFTRIFAPFVEMFGVPKYNEIDPTPFLALTYTIIFGIMFGDVGQGAVLALIGLLLWKKKKMWMGRILACVGLSSVVFGFVYGSIFGYEHILHGFKVLEGGNTMTMLMVAVMIGVLLILVCISINIANGIKQKDIKKIFFSANGMPGLVLYLGIAAGVVANAYFGINLLNGGYILAVVGLPLFVMMASEPLTKLIKREPDWMPKSIGMFFVEGFFEIFETVLSYVSNTISFLRIGAFAISHAGMMMVVFLLSENANGGNNLFGVILGNIVVTGIEVVLVCIQVMRLEFYEMFGRFYSSGGNRFEPKIIDYTSAAVNAN